jgi:hypothetical protein
MIAIVNGQFPSLGFPYVGGTLKGTLLMCFQYLHATLRRYPGTAGPLQLQHPVLVAHHPVFTHHTFFLQPEDFVQLPRCRASPVIIGLRRRGTRVTSVVLG